jgi:predicted kinase
MQQTVIIVSGIPGSGKSTFVRGYCPNGEVFTADAFPGLYVDGELQPALIGPAHQWCLRNFTQRLVSGAPLLVVDNTNTTAVEIAPYAALAQAYGAELEILTIECDVETGLTRNTHGAPREVVETLAKQLAERELPPWWPERRISHIEMASAASSKQTQLSDPEKAPR